MDKRTLSDEVSDETKIRSDSRIEKRQGMEGHGMRDELYERDYEKSL